MARSRFGRWWESVLSIGADPTESDIRRGKRRILVGYLFIGALTRAFVSAIEFSEGSLEGWVDLVAAIASAVLLVMLARRPGWFSAIVNAALAALLIEVLAASVIDGGLVRSEMIVLFGLLAVVGALILLPVRAAFAWTFAFLVTVVLAAVLPTWIEPLQEPDWSEGGMATTIVGVTVFVFAGMAYFVRQRDRFQAESDDLLHNILPDDIAKRLKAGSGMIADDCEEASVLFADVVDFTPMSADLSPAELVGLLNSLFTVFDGFVEELGLEKIKTVGDAYMVASGIPSPRPDHAEAIAELALRMRNHTREHEVGGHRISLRIGINSGPVVAGIVGTHKFAYDLWGDVVNTASRMESSGIPDAIQMTSATHSLIEGRFVCESRGTVEIKGKGAMDTYLLVAERPDREPPPVEVEDTARS
jgi:guanylate cyclase